MTRRGTGRRLTIAVAAMASGGEKWGISDDCE